MVKSEITFSDFQSDSTNLKNNNTCIIVMMLSNCPTCKKYMAALDNNNISYYYLQCNQSNMDIVTRIAKKIGLSNLAVPVVLKYINGVYNNKCSNKIEDIHNI